MKKPSLSLPRAVLIPATAAAVFAISGAASAQDAAGSCPPGSWFCAEPAPAPAPAPAAPGALQPLPSPAPEARPEAAKTEPKAEPKVDKAPPPVVVYQPAPPVMVVQPRAEAPAPYEYKPSTPSWYRQKEWGLNVHLMGAILGRRSAADAGMGGIGFGLRLKPSPYVGLEGNVDFVGGRDYEANGRGETIVSGNLLLFLNPKSRLQVYLLGGVGGAWAKVYDDGWSGPSRSYGYFGGQAGLGVEFRISRHFALNLDGRGFVRTRVDGRADYDYEFRDASGRGTNTSGGGLVTGGMTFYF